MEMGHLHASTPWQTGQTVNEVAMATQMGTTTALKSKSTVVRGSKRKLRKSCEFCRERKKRCDGDGVNRCSLCIAKGQPECQYNERVSTGSRNSVPFGGMGGASAAMMNAQAAGVVGRGVAGMMHAGDWDAAEGCRISGRNAFARVSRAGASNPGLVKRCRFTASPATGLVGMQENQFLGDFFDCMGFLPLASEGDIRQALVSLMLSSLAPEQRELEDESFVGTDFMSKRCGTMGEDGSIIAADRRPSRFPNTDASTCALWCVIAIGALVRGSPPEMVEGYAQLARESLAWCFDDVSPEIARAFILMAFLHNFLGDEAKFRKFLAFAHGTVSALKPGGVHENFLDVLNIADSAQLYTGVSPSKEEVEDYCRQDLPTKPAKGIGRQKELYCLFLQTDHRLDQALFRDMSELGLIDAPAQTTAGMDRNGPFVPFSAVEVEATPLKEDKPEYGAVGGGVAGNGDEDEYSASEQVFEDSSKRLPGQALSSHMLSLEALPEYQRLLDVATWPEIRTGVGGLMFNGALAYLSGLASDLHGSMKGVVRFAHVLVTYPGLCRFSIWRHQAHSAFAMLAKTGSIEMYEKLRAAYNSVKAPHLPAVPPMAEWATESVCDHVFCRSIFSIVCPPSQDVIDSLQRNLDWKVFRDTGGELPCPSEESDSESASSLVLPTMLRTASTPGPRVVMRREAAESFDARSRIKEAAPVGAATQGDVESVVRGSRPEDDTAAECAWREGGESELGVLDIAPEACLGTGDGGAVAMTTMGGDENELSVLAGFTAQGAGEAASRNLMRWSSDDSLLRELLCEGLGDDAGREPYQGTC